MVHRLRSSISAGEGSDGWQPEVSSEPGRRKGKAEAPVEAERRSGDERRAERKRGLVERAALVFRGKTSLVPVLNSSKGGVTIETALDMKPGDTVRIAIPGQDACDAMVRWVRGGRVGLHIGALSI